MAFITVEGENKIALQQGNAQLLVVDSFVLANIDGLGAEPADRIETMPAGGDIVADLAVTRSGYVNTSQVVYSLVMDSTLGPFDFNWVGLVDADGVVIAVVYVPLTSKTATVGPVPGNNLTRNFLLAFSDIQATTAIAVPAETWQIDFTARLLGIDERERLSNFDIYGLAAFFGNGWQVVRQGATTTYDVKAGIGYVGGVRAENVADQQFTDAGPAGVWLDVSLEGDISDVSAVVAIVVDGAAHVDYTDGNGFDHYLTQIADIAANGDVTDLRVNADHEAKADPHPQYWGEPTTLDETDDLDLITAPGLYNWQSLAPDNAPANYCGMLVQDTGQPMQLVWGGVNHQLLVRRKSSGSWAPWMPFLSHADFAADVDVWAGTVTDQAVTPGGLASFAKSLVDGGYQVMPGGLILQWGGITTSADSQNFNYPIAFPNAALTVVISESGDVEAAGNVVQAELLSASQFVAANATAGSSAARFIAIGH